jgi:ATP-binding cassette, subfamily B, bacterial MsbA
MTGDLEILKRLFKDYTKKYIKKIILSFIFTIILAASTSSVAYLLDPAIKKLFINPDQKMKFLIPGLIVLAFFAKGSSLYLAKLLMIKVSESVRRDMQIDMFKSLISADTKLIDSKHSGKFITNLTNDIGMITTLVSVAILNIFKDSLTLIGLLSVMFYQNWKLALIAIIMIPLASGAARTLGKRISKVTIQQMNTSGTFMSYLFEVFNNHRIIKIFQNENYEKKRATLVLDELKARGQKIAEIMVRASPVMEFLTGIMIAVLIYVAAILVANNELDVGKFFSFLAAMMLAYQPVRSLATINMTIQQGLAGAKRVLPVIDEKPEVNDKENVKDLVFKKGQIIFENVNFNYSKEDITLKSIDLEFPGEKMTALVGQSGAGKSTILNLIPRLYNIKDGDIKIDQQSIYDCSIFSLRKGISLVSQDTTLFDDTIKNNIAYANLDATEEEIKEAAKHSYADEFIKKLPNKYETLIGENGVRLSGGEKQRLSIARAILKKSPVILLDEATSSLDAETENKIQKAINFLTKGRTTIVIAHRLSTILNSDKICVIDNGQVVQTGTHDELLNNSKIYKNFYEKQIKRQE